MLLRLALAAALIPHLPVFLSFLFQPRTSAAGRTSSRGRPLRPHPRFANSTTTVSLHPPRPALARRPAGLMRAAGSSAADSAGTLRRSRIPVGQLRTIRHAAIDPLLRVASPTPSNASVAGQAGDQFRPPSPAEPDFDDDPVQPAHFEIHDVPPRVADSAADSASFAACGDEARRPSPAAASVEGPLPLSRQDTVLQALASVRDAVLQLGDLPPLSARPPSSSTADCWNAAGPGRPLHLDLPTTMGEFASGSSEQHNRTHSFSVSPRPGALIPLKIKEKIWGHQFVDFYDLLYPHQEQAYTLALNSVDGPPSLKFLPKRKSFLSELDWSCAFDEFLAVYVGKFPEELGGLLSYSRFIKSMMKDRLNWRMYDQKFRMAREVTRCTWETIRIDLQLECTRSLPPLSPSVTPAQTPAVAHPPVGYCFQYHAKGRFCSESNCAYKHSCPRCGGPHPMYHRPCTASRKPYQGPRQGPRKNFQAPRPFPPRST